MHSTIRRPRFGRTHRSPRQGAIAAFAASLIIVLIVMVAFGVEIGKLTAAINQCQRAADAAALAAAWEMKSQLDSGASYEDAAKAARAVAVDYVENNPVLGLTVSPQHNDSNSSNGDIVFGYFTDFGDPNGSFVAGSSSNVNAVKVTVRREDSLNSEVSFSFASLFGVSSHKASAHAIAAWVNQIRGFKNPGSQTINAMPFVILEDDWDELMAGFGTDNLGWNDYTESVESYGDGTLEIKLYPTRTNSPGNFGTVDIGASNNSTKDLSRQISEGISSEDLSYLGGKLELNEYGYLDLNGDTGISNGIKDELDARVGDKTVIMIYDSVTETGNTATYRIVRFVGVRVMDVNMTGKNKEVVVQPETVTPSFTIAATSSDGNTSDYVSANIRLVQ